MAQYYDQGEYTFFDIAPLRYSNWAEYQKGVTELLKGYKSIKLTVNDDAQIHTDGNLTWAAATVKEERSPPPASTKWRRCAGPSSSRSRPASG